MLIGLMAGPVCALAIVLWWVFFSRAPWAERLGAVGLMVAALYATSRLIDKSIATGAQGMLFPILAIPALSLAFVVWAVATSRLSDGVRRATMVATILCASGAWVLVRTGGRYPGGSGDRSWLLIKHKDDWAGDVDITTFAPKSVKSEGDFEDILAQDRPDVWESNRAGGRPAQGGEAGAMLAGIIERAMAIKEGRATAAKATTKTAKKKTAVNTKRTRS